MLYKHAIDGAAYSKGLQFLLLQAVLCEVRHTPAQHVCKMQPHSMSLSCKQ